MANGSTEGNSTDTSEGRYGYNPSSYSTHAKVLAMAPDGSRVLDIGCGQGHIARKLAKRECTVFGVEIDEDSAKVAREHCAEVLVADMDVAQELPWSGASFDVILCMDVLEHLKDPARALKLLRCYLKPGGQLLVTLPNVANWWVRFRLLRGRWDYYALGIMDSSHLRFFTLKTARQLLTECGLRIVKMDVTPGAGAFAPYHYTIGKLLRLFKADERVDYWLSRRFPTFFGLQFIFAARLDDQANPQ